MITVVACTVASWIAGQVIGLDVADSMPLVPGFWVGFGISGGGALAGLVLGALIRRATHRRAN